MNLKALLIFTALAIGCQGQNRHLGYPRKETASVSSSSNTAATSSSTTAPATAPLEEHYRPDDPIVPFDPLFPYDPTEREVF